MLVATLKGMLAHKLRLLLTGTSIALGVAFLAGTLMLTDSMQRAFDDLFADVNASSDVVVRAESKLDLSPSDERPSMPADVLGKIRQVDGVTAAEGTVQGYALLVGSDGKATRVGYREDEVTRDDGRVEIKRVRISRRNGEDI